MVVHGLKTKSTTKKVSLSYWSKEKCVCPICRKEFDREVMLTGQGRMIAGKLTDELHRVFEPSKKYGLIYPLIYEIGACPNCYTAMLWSDFKEMKNKDAVDVIYMHSDKRKNAVQKVFPYFDLTRQRTLFDGCAMYYMALLTYEDVAVDMLPTMKRAFLSLRLAWLCDDLNVCIPGYNYDFISKLLYQKANFFYQQAIVNEVARTEKCSLLDNCGPDMDKNYGWDGVIYLRGLLEYKYGQREDQQLRLKKLSESKMAIARIFGLGKSSKAKPGPLLEKSRDLYDKLSLEVSDDTL